MDNEISVFSVLGCEKDTKQHPLASSNMAFSNSSFHTFSLIKILSIYPLDLISWSAPYPCPAQTIRDLKVNILPGPFTLFPPLDHYPPRSRTPAGLARIISRCHHDRYLGSGNAPFVRQGLPITPVIIFNFATFTAGKWTVGVIFRRGRGLIISQ